MVMTGSIDYHQLAEEITALITEKKCGPILVRLGWHECGTYDAKTKTGGPYGLMRFSPVKDHDANKGLAEARELLEPFKAKYPSITYADLWTFVATVAISAMGGPKIPFRPGRIDATAEQCTPDGRLPDAKQGANHLRDIFHRMGFSDREIVTLSGAHTLGRCHPDRSGFDGIWTVLPNRFDNVYFVDLFKDNWNRVTLSNGIEQFNNAKKKTMMLPSDMALLDDPVFKPIAQEYANDKELFFEDFKKVFQKLMELGVTQHLKEEVSY